MIDGITFFEVVATIIGLALIFINSPWMTNRVSRQAELRKQKREQGDRLFKAIQAAVAYRNTPEYWGGGGVGTEPGDSIRYKINEEILYGIEMAAHEAFLLFKELDSIHFIPRWMTLCISESNLLDASLRERAKKERANIHALLADLAKKLSEI